MKTIYVAAGSDHRGDAAAAMDILRSAGWKITYDWTREHLWDVKKNRELTSEEALAAARRDEDGVFSAQMLWLMLPEKKSEGAHFELGFFRGLMRAGLQKTGIVISGDISALGRIFPTLGDRIFADHADALAYLCTMV